MTDYDDHGNCASNMYLSNCTYYVSAPDFSSVSSFLPQSSSCQVNFPYSSSITQVQPVREVAFRDYGLDHPSKWHYRGNYASYYSTDDIMHRELLQSSNRAEMLFKNESVYSHGSSNSACNFLTNVGRNGVLPQGFDQFFDSVSAGKPNPEAFRQKIESSVPGDEACNKMSSNSMEQTKRDPAETTEEESSQSTFGHEEKNNASSM